jgi:hypothetical protein
MSAITKQAGSGFGSIELSFHVTPEKAPCAILKSKA